jgi:hypothetical protein
MKSSLLVVTLLTSSVAFAQTGKKPTVPAADSKPTTPAEAKPADAKAVDAKPADAKAVDAKPTDAKAVDATTPPPPPASDRDSSDPYEAPGRLYQFVGARYRGTIVPKFLLNAFVSEGSTIYSNSIGVEYERRTDGFSIIPSLSYTEYGTGDMLFLEKGKPDTVIGNWVAVNSSMKGIYAAVDLLWSAKINKQFAFEFGFGVGLGVIFDSLVINWVKDDPNGNLKADNGRKFAFCATVNDGPGCTARDHSNSTELKVGGYQEKGWFSGGSKPVLFPTITVPNLGLRFKPHRAFASRLQVGFSLTGFWFGISGSYGFPSKPANRGPSKPSDNVEVEENVE